jgi:DNA-directed RNA polymerase subunit RPC12/RpoP
MPSGRRATPPGLRILVAGVDKDARGVVEASVRDALGSRAERGSWSISVVSMAGRWSVTLDGPDERLRGVSFVADGSRLVDAIREAVDGQADTPANDALAAYAPAPAVAAAPASGAGDRHVCEHCGKTVVVTYEERPGEAKALAAVACPHCWQIGHVEIGAWAASGGEYRAEKG